MVKSLCQIDADNFFVVANVRVLVSQRWHAPDNLTSKCRVGLFDHFDAVNFRVTFGRKFCEQQFAQFVE